MLKSGEFIGQRNRIKNFLRKLFAKRFLNLPRRGQLLLVPKFRAGLLGMQAIDSGLIFSRLSLCAFDKRQFDLMRLVLRFGKFSTQGIFAFAILNLMLLLALFGLRLLNEQAIDSGLIVFRLSLCAFNKCPFPQLKVGNRFV